MQSNIKEEKTLAMPLTDFQLRRQTQLWVSYCCWPVCCKAFYLSIIICNRLLSSPPLPRYRVLVYICNNCCFRKWLHSTGGCRAAFWDQSSVARIRADSLLTLTPFGWYSDALLSLRSYWDLHAALWDYFPWHPWFCICYPPAIFPLLSPVKAILLLTDDITGLLQLILHKSSQHTETGMQDLTLAANSWKRSIPTATSAPDTDA